MGTLYTDISNGEPGIPATWNVRLSQLEVHILNLLDAGPVKTIIPWTLVGSDTMTLTISNIPQTYRHLILKMNIIVNIGGGGPGEIAMQIWPNSDVAAGQNQRGNWTTVGTASASNPSKGHWFSANKDKTAKPTPASVIILIPNYSSSFYKKHALTTTFMWRDSASCYREMGWGRFALAGTDPITSLSMNEQGGVSNIKANTGFSIVGMGAL